MMRAADAVAPPYKAKQQAKRLRLAPSCIYGRIRERSIPRIGVKAPLRRWTGDGSPKRAALGPAGGLVDKIHPDRKY